MNGTLKPSTLEPTAERRLRIPHVWRNGGTFVMFVLLVSNALPIDYRKRISEDHVKKLAIVSVDVIPFFQVLTNKYSLALRLNTLLFRHFAEFLSHRTQEAIYYELRNSIKLSPIDKSLNVDCRAPPTYSQQKVEELDQPSLDELRSL